MPVYNLHNIKEHEIIKGYHARFVHSDHMTHASFRVEEGAEIPEHSHIHEQVSTIVDGTFELILEGKNIIMKKGSVVIIPSNALHSGKALTDCRIIDIFIPAREDYKKLSGK